MKAPCYLLFFILFTQSIFAFECSQPSSIYNNSGKDGKQYLHYKFGATNSITVDIVDGEENCEVYIYDEKDLNVHTICDKTAILEWAFSEMADDLKRTNIEINNTYKLFHYQLSLMNGNCVIVTTTSNMQIPNNEELTSKLAELRSFIINFWVEELKEKL